jgi:hypothetical protein
LLILLLALRLGQSVVQIALNFNTLLPFGCRRCLTLSRGRGNRRQRNILLGVAGSLLLRLLQVRCTRLIVALLPDRLMLFSPEAVCSLEEDDGAFSAEPMPTISSSSTRTPRPS